MVELFIVSSEESVGVFVEVYCVFLSPAVQAVSFDSIAEFLVGFGSFAVPLGSVIAFFE